MKKTVQHIIQIGETEYPMPVTLRSETEDSVTIDVASLMDAQRVLARRLIKETRENPSHELFNYLVNISGLTNSEIASYMRIEPSAISQWRRGSKGLSATAWQAFRMFFDDFFLNGRVTNELLVENKQCA